MLRRWRTRSRRGSRELSGVILYPAAAEPSQDLAAALAAVGLQVRQAAVYETVAALPSAALVERLPQIDGVLRAFGQGRAGRWRGS